ncbi:MAG: hypothetical protein U0Q07_11050 [Acidimicrobiales bacterium]
MRWTAKPGRPGAVVFGAVVLGAVVVAVAVGCGAGPGHPATSAPAVTGSSAGGTVGPPTAAAADGICARVDAEVAAVPQPTRPADVEPYLRRLVELYRGEVDELRSLAGATADPRWAQLVVQLSTYFDLVEADLPRLAQDPTRMNAPGTPAGEALGLARRQAEALGLRVCGASGSSGSADPTTPASTSPPP